MVKVLSRDKIQRMVGASGGSSSGGGSSSSMAGYASMGWVEENYLSKEFFNRLFTIHGETTDEDTQETTEVDVLPNDVDTTVLSIEGMFGFWTQQYISALGQGEGGGGGGSSTLANLLDVVLTSPSNGQVLTYDITLGKWVNGAASAGTTYTFAEGSTNGAFLVTPSSGIAQSVPIHGLGDLAYKSALLASDIPPITRSKISDFPRYWAWDDITGTPNTLSGYRITDAVSSSTTWWGQIIVDSEVTGPMTGVTNINSLLYFDTTNGRVGVNDSSPSAALSVSGDLRVKSPYTASNFEINFDSDNTLTLYATNHYTRTGYPVIGVSLTESASHLFIGMYSHDHLTRIFGNNVVAYSRNEDNWIEAIRTTSAGNVWIGRTSSTTARDECYLQIGMVRLVYDETNNAIKVVGSDGTTEANLYATGSVSALGAGSGGGTTVSSLSDLVDVELTSPANGQVLKYDSTQGKWVNSTETIGTTYTFAEGTTNGAFQVTPSNGTAQSVAIHGLGSLAYKSSLTASDIPSITKSKISDFPTEWAWNDITGKPEEWPWDDISGKPNTLAGYGINDAVKNDTTWWGQTISSSGAVTGNISNTGNITPTTTGTSDLGSSSLKYHDLYLSSSAKIGSNTICTTGSGTGYMTISAVSNELCLACDTDTMYVNYRSVTGKTSPSVFVWMAGTNTTFADHHVGKIKLGGTNGITLEYDSTNQALHVVGGIYADTFVSAMGAGSGGGTVVLSDLLTSLNGSGLNPASASNKVLVNNAGISISGLVQDVTDLQWQELFDVNLKSMFNLCRAFVPGMVSRKSGCIVNISSMWGQVGASYESVYSASKGGVDAFTRSLAKELGPSGIRVNAVSPGCILTEMCACYSEEDLKALADETALGRNGSAQDIANAVAFLASEKASFITGQILGVNGGMVI